MELARGGHGWEQNYETMAMPFGKNRKTTKLRWRRKCLALVSTSIGRNQNPFRLIYAAAEIALLYGVIYAENCIRIYRYWVFVS